jgi:hypothetical protein
MLHSARRQCFAADAEQATHMVEAKAQVHHFGVSPHPCPDVWRLP